MPKSMNFLLGSSLHNFSHLVTTRPIYTVLLSGQRLARIGNSIAVPFEYRFTRLTQRNSPDFEVRASFAAPTDKTKSSEKNEQDQKIKNGIIRTRASHMHIHATSYP